MTKELAKTLTTALVQFIDRERPEGTMDCSSGECVSLEKAFTKDDFNSVETLVNKKLRIPLTPFQQYLSGVLRKAHFVVVSEDELNDTLIGIIRAHTNDLLALAKKELLKDDELAKKHLEGYTLGKEDAMRDMMDFVESHFHGKNAKEFDTPTINIPAWEPPCYRGGPCTNPMRDCINCPGNTIGGGLNTSSGTSTAVLHGNTSATDGEPHNPSFTD